MALFGSRLLTVCYRTFSIGSGLVRYISSGCAIRLVAFGAVEYIRLLWSPRILEFDNLASLRHMVELGHSWMSCCAQVRVFWLAHPS